MRNRTSDACVRLHRSKPPFFWRTSSLLNSTAVHFRLRPHRSTSVFRMPQIVATVLFLAFATLCVNVRGQTAQKRDAATELTELLKGEPDVTIFVIPTSGDTARVALGFSSRVSHARVRKEIERLSENGWGIANDLSLTDRSAGPSGRVTTAGHFSLIKAPQVVNNAPALLPYLQAFQDRGHVTVVFLLSELKPYNGIDKFETPALVVRRMPADNAYQYEALIQDHKGKLPAITATEPSQVFAPQSTNSISRSESAAIPLLPVMLIICIVGLLGGLGMYIWLARRANKALRRRAR